MIPELDGLRFIAIAAVIMFHLRLHLGQIHPDIQSGGLYAFSNNLRSGVQLFFVISGFILALPFARQRLCGAPKVRLGAYYLRRITRLEPPYILCMLLFFIQLLAISQFSPVVLLCHLLASLLYIHDIVYHYQSLINGVAWSLEVEIQFYLFAPVLAYVFAVRSLKFRRALLVFTCVALTVGQSMVHRHTGIVNATFLGFAQFFLCGFLLADVFLVDWKEEPAESYWFDLVALLGWPILLIVANDHHLSRHLFHFAILIVYYAAFRAPVCRCILRNALVTCIGGMCYSLYLLHQNEVIYKLVDKLTPFPNLPFSVLWCEEAVIYVPVTLFVAGCYFVLIERPCMRKAWPGSAWGRVRASLRYIGAQAETCSSVRS